MQEKSVAPLNKFRPCLLYASLELECLLCCDKSCVGWEYNQVTCIVFTHICQIIHLYVANKLDRPAVEIDVDDRSFRRLLLVLTVRKADSVLY